MALATDGAWLERRGSSPGRLILADFGCGHYSWQEERGGVITETAEAGFSWRAVWDLSRPVKMILGGGLLSAIGDGIIFPYLFIYLHNVVGIRLALCGVLLALIGVAGLIATPVAARLVDRVGSRRSLTLALALMAAGYGSLYFANGPLSVGASLAVAGYGNGIFWPSHKALLAVLVPPGRRHIAFAFDAIGTNIGIGLGALTGGVFIAIVGKEYGYSLLFLLDAVTFTLFALVVLAIRSTPTSEGLGPAEQEAEDDPQPGTARGWRLAFRNRALRRILGTQLLLVVAGVVAVEQLMPVYLKNFAGVPASLLGIIFAVNVVASVLLQVPVTRAVEGHSRAICLCIAMLLWALLWVVMALATSVASGIVVLVTACLVTACYGIGESIVAIIVDPTVSDIAPPHMLGLFMSALTLVWNIGLIIGPIFGGAVMQLYPPVFWPLLAGLLLLAGVSAIGLRRDLPASARLVQTT